MTTNLLVYPSTLPGEPLERYAVEGLTLHQWLAANVDGYAPGDKQPISATVNGVVVEPAQWADTHITADTVVELRPQPQGVETLIIAAVAAAVAVAATILLKPSLPSQKNRGTRGSKLLEANAEGNTARLGDVIPELAGRHKRYPDYLTAPRRYFVDPKTQALDLFLCIGRGEYNIPPEEIRIGETPIGKLGQSIDYRIFEPGESVIGHVAHRRWYNAPEVGPTSGGSGVRLRNATENTPSLHASAITLSGQTLTIPNGAGSIPSDWNDGMRVRLSLLDEIEVVDGGQDVNDVYLRDILKGDFAAYTAGDPITISGGSPLDGDYLVATFTSGTSPDPDEMTLDRADSTPEAWLSPGVYMAAIDTTGITYRIDSIATDRKSMTLTRMLPDDSEDTGWAGWANQTTRDFQLRLDERSINNKWAGPFLACPPGELTSFVEWDIFAPQGLGYVEDDGAVTGLYRRLEIQWREAGTLAWTTEVVAMNGSSRDQLGWTFTLSLPYSMVPEIRVRRTIAEKTGTQYMDKLEWYGLRSELVGVKYSYPGITTLAMTITGSSAIASQTESQVSLVATRKLPTRSGGTWTAPQATRDIAPWVAHIAKSAGYTDADIDLDELDRLDAIWQGRGDRFDFVEADDSTVKESLNRALRAGMAELTIDAGRIKPVRDEPRTTLEAMYTPQNMLEPLARSVSAPRHDDPDGVDVEYIDAATWTEETVECRLPGDAGVKPEKVRLDGVTDRTRAWRIGMRRRRELKYRRWDYRFSTELDALNSRYMSYVALADDVPGYGQSSLLWAVESEGAQYRLTLSEPMDWSGTGHVVAWRRPDGSLAGPFAAAQGDDDHELLATHGGEPMPTVSSSQEPPHVLFGTAERWSFPVLVSAVNPQGFESVSVEAVNYDSRVYADDDNAPP